MNGSSARAPGVERVEPGPTAGGWSAHGRAMLHAVDRLTRDRDLDDESWAVLTTHPDTRQAIERRVGPAAPIGSAARRG
jgi:hypothetical protein